MVISLREIVDKCLALHGNFSVVRDLLGYDGNRVPGITSLIQELSQLRDRKHVTIHIKAVSTPTVPFSSRFPIDEMVFSMRQVYNEANIGVIIGSTENLSLDDTDINVGECKTELTNDQKVLFKNRNFARPNDIVVYLVRAVFANGMMQSGCATLSTGPPGVVVGNRAPKLTIAHEVGHHLVGPHIEQAMGQPCPTELDPPELDKCQLTNIMTCCGTGRIPFPRIVPAFDSNQIQRIIDSNLTGFCAE